MSVRVRRIVVRVAVIAAVVTASIVLNQHAGLGIDPTVWRDRIAPLGWLAPAAYILAASLRPLLLLPSWVVMSAGGLLFGVAGGMLWGSIGFTLGAVGSFSLTRFLGRNVVVEKLGERAVRIDARIRRSGTPWIAFYTGIPVTPLSPVHAAAGLTAVPLSGFAVAVAIGIIPRTALFAYFGDTLAHGDATQIALAGVILLAASGLGAFAARWLGVGADKAEDSSSEGQ